MNASINESPAVPDAARDEIRTVADKLRQAIMDARRTDRELEKALWRGLRPQPPWNPDWGPQE